MSKQFFADGPGVTSGGRGTPDYYKLTREDELKLKTLLQYAFADSPTFDGLTETERAILGDADTFVRIVSWSCEGEANPYVARNVYGGHFKHCRQESPVDECCGATQAQEKADSFREALNDCEDEPQSHDSLCASRASGECTCGEFERQEASTLTLEELKHSAHELNDYSVARGVTTDPDLLAELGLRPHSVGPSIPPTPLIPRDS